MIAPHTVVFASPEQLFNNKDDINLKQTNFSIGVTIYYILTDKFPYGDIEEIGGQAFYENLCNNKIYNIKIYKLFIRWFCYIF